MANCELCGEPMSEAESVFKFHGYSGPCPKPPLPKTMTINTAEIEARLSRLNVNGIKGQEVDYHTLLHHDFPTIIDALKAETARADEAEEELEDERSWWPKWGLEIKAILERYGVDYSYTDEINLPGDLEDWIAEWTSADKAKQADLQSQLTAANEKLAAARGHTEWLGEYLNGLLQDKAVKATFAREHATVLHAKVNAILDAFNTGDGNGR